MEQDPNAVPSAPLGVDDGSPQQDGQVSVSNAFPTDAGPDVAPEPDPSGGSARSGNDSCSGSAALDTNALIHALDNGEASEVDKALAGRVPIVSPTAASEFLVRGDAGALDEFLSARGGRIGQAGTQEGAGALQTHASRLGRALGLNDALIAHSAILEGVPLITGDQQLLRFLTQIGCPAEGL